VVLALQGSSLNDTPRIFAPPSVLIADDDEFSVEYMRGLLARLGVTDIVCAQDGSSALRLLACAARAPDFLVCDVFMPGMDGIELLDRLARLHFRGGILLVSGVDESILGLSGFIAINEGLRVLGSMVKPVEIGHLADAFGLHLA
jgi:CheY-like chemotaxis protein